MNTRRGATGLVGVIAGLALVVSTMSACGSRRPASELEDALSGIGATTSQAVSGPAGVGGPVDIATSAAPVANVPGATFSSGVPSGGVGGRSGGGSANPGGGGRVASGPRCTGKEQPIVLGSVGEQSGIAGAAVASGPKTVAAWVAYTNAHGGLACHPVKYIIADDGGSPAQNAALTQQLVQQDHVVAFVQNDAPLAASGSEQFLAQNDIPVIGSESAEQFYYTHPNFFPQISSGNASTYADLAGIAAALTPSQRDHFAMVTCLEAAQCTLDAKIGPGMMGQVGLKLVFAGTASLTQPDFTSSCLSAQKAGATSLWIVLDPNSVHRFAQSCASVNYHPVLAAPESVIVADAASDPNLNGLIIPALAAPWTDNSLPLMALMNQVLQQYAPGVTNVGGSRHGWISAQLLQYASRFFPAKDMISSADILAAMGKVKNYDVGGLTGPLTFIAGHDAPVVTCWWSMKLSGGKFVGLNGNKRSCK